MNSRTTVLLAVVLVGVGIGCRGEVGASGAATQGPIREPAVAGQFYPADVKQLSAALDGFLRDAVPPGPGPERPIAIVVPHAGYPFSGQIAADGWRQAMGQEYDTVVLLGTNHTTAGFSRIGVYPGGGMRTPLGVVPVDETLSAALLKEDGDCVADASIHSKEHSIEVHLPFVQRLFPKASIVAAVVGTQDAAAISRFGRALAKVLGSRRALVVASSDLSHYPSARDAVSTDRRTLEAFASLDPDRANVDATMPPLSNLATCACGESPVRAAIVAAKALGATRGRVVSYANSGDVAPGDAERVVGYGAVVYTGGERGSDTSVLAPRPAVPPDAPVPAADKKVLLSVARSTITRYLESGTLPLPRGLSAAADRPQGVFVTLRKRGELRGCIGQMAPNGPLRRLVSAMAFASAFEDPRFDKVRAPELKDIEIEISVLTPFKEVPGPNAIVVGRDGVLLQKDRHSAVFLPQVATEEGWSRDEMLDNLCLKGGLPAGCWHAGAKLSTFQADVFREGQFK